MEVMEGGRRKWELGDGETQPVATPSQKCKQTISSPSLLFLVLGPAALSVIL